MVVFVKAPSPAALRRTTGRRTEQTTRRRGRMFRTVREKFEVIEAGRADQVRAHTVSFASTLFEIFSN